MIQLFPLGGFGEVAPRHDLAELLCAAIAGQSLLLHPGDILVVTQKIVSKAEGRLVSLADVVPGPEAISLAERTQKDPRLVELVLVESESVVRAVPGVLITRHRLGFVMANAGIDRSNLGPEKEEHVLLLPRDPDRSAEELAHRISARTGIRPAIVISDSFGRPWRRGVVAVALGAAGLPALLDRRGEVDRDGRRLEVTQVGVADLIASAAALLTGEGSEGIPAVLLRGFSVTGPALPAQALVRPLDQDLFR